jgi:hypothetical protein
MTMLIGSSTAAERVVEMVFGDLAAQRIAVNSQDFGRATLIATGVFQNAPDEFLLELRHGFFEQNAAIDHHSDQRIQLFFHVCMLRSEASRETSAN